MTTLKNYSVFYFENGIRRRTDLTNPKLRPFTDLLLPKNSHIHYMPDPNGFVLERDIGPKRNEPLYFYLNRRVSVEHISTLATTIGNPRRITVPFMAAVSQYHKREVFFKRLIQPLGTVRDPNSFTLSSYAGTIPYYVYKSNPMARYYAWLNRTNTLWQNVKNVYRVASNRHQFLFFELPEVLPSLNILRRAEKKQDVTTLRFFMSDEARLNVLMFWSWLGDIETLTKLADITLSEMSQINLVFTYKGYYAFINMSNLINFKSGTYEDETGEEVTIKGLNPLMMQKLFLHFLLNFSAKVMDSDDSLTSDLPVLAQSIKDGKIERNKDKVIQKGEEDKADTDTDTVLVEVNDKSSKGISKLVEEEPELYEEEDDKSLDEFLDKELTMHDKIVSDIEKKAAEVKEDTTSDTSLAASIQPFDTTDGHVYTPVDKPQATIALDKAKQLVEDGVLSVAEYNKIQQLHGKFASLTIPTFLDKDAPTVAEFIDIKEKDLQIESNTTIRDIDVVFDKSLLGKTVSEFNKEYNNKLLMKHIVTMLLSYQADGSVITDIQITEEKDVANDFIIFNVSVLPVGGKLSQQTFKIPRPTEKGTFISGGVEYYLKNQEVDLPIRKLNSSRVALSSYYPAKLFIDRFGYMTYNYTRWLHNVISKLAMDSTNDIITHLKTKQVYHGEKGLPRTYTAIGSKFSEFTLTYSEGLKGSLVFKCQFDPKERFTAFKGIDVKDIESKTGFIFVGYSPQAFLLMDKEGGCHIYRRINAKITESFTCLEELFGIAEDKRPKDVAVIQIFGKPLPLGLVLTYYLGFKSLLKTLKVNATWVAKGHSIRQSDSPTTFRLKFKSGSLMLDLKDPKASLIVRSLRMYSDSFTNIDPVDLEDKTTIISMFEDNGIPIRFTRELNVIRELFIDPITKDVLKMIKEPTDFIKLLFRANELLVDDHFVSDDEGIPQIQIKGYQRIAGHVYRDIVDACRKRQQQTVLSKARYDLNPESTKMNILLDPSKEVYDGINPMKVLKASEAVTLSGTGGRNKDGLRTKESRMFTKSDLGIISEATVDSSGVGINTFLSPDANLNNLLGVVRKLEKDDGVAKLVSTSMLLSPGSDHDDQHLGPLI